MKYVALCLLAAAPLIALADDEQPVYRKGPDGKMIAIYPSAEAMYAASTPVQASPQSAAICHEGEAGPGGEVDRHAEDAAGRQYIKRDLVTSTCEAGKWKTTVKHLN